MVMGTPPEESPDPGEQGSSKAVSPNRAAEEEGSLTAWLALPGKILAKSVSLVNSNLRYKLLLLVLGPILLLTPTVIALASYWTSNYTYQQLFLKVNTDLLVAQNVFQRIQTDHRLFLKSLADSYYFRTLLDNQQHGRLQEQLQNIASERDYAFLNLLSPDTSERHSSSGFHSWRPRSSSLLQRVREVREPGGGIEIYSNSDLARENPALAKSIILPLVDTPRAVPTEREREDRAMVIRVLQPVYDINGDTVAILEGGVLLNGNFGFVDAIRDLVYGPGSLAEGSLGTVTVFLDDVRISTNVPGAAAERAIGTRVSTEVRNTVLENRETWVDRAFVVEDWYISAYEPIIDVDGNSVGMLYAGYLEAPFRAAMMRALVIVSCVLALGTLLAGLVAVLGAHSIFRPIESMADVVRGTKSGKTLRIGEVGSKDEIGELALEFDSMLDTLEENQHRMEADAADLEVKILKRTSELQRKNLHLQDSIDLLRRTRQQLAMAEKLAALGELTAGVAHEINNPTAVILGNMDVLTKEIGSHSDHVRTEIDLIVEQVYRIRSIIDRLLQYSRPSEYAGYVEDLDVEDVIRDTLLLVHHELVRSSVKLQENYVATPPIQINRQELQQVIINLILNATHAVSKGGEVSVSTELWGSKGVMITVRDNGSGIPANHLQRVFDPFYTAGKESGTGLGLSVSYGIIRRYGGRITVDSLVGEWTEFQVRLLFTPVFESDDEQVMSLSDDALSPSF